jgi:antitoxin component YwqK of YwqJK toxin-antitoxin module
MALYKQQNILSLIYEYDSTYREIFRGHVLIPNMIPIHYYQEDDYIQKNNDGLHKIYRGTQCLEEFYTKNDEYDGSQKIYVNRKLITINNYKNGKFDGFSYDYDIKDGSIERKAHYINGDRTYTKIYKRIPLYDGVYDKFSIPSNYVLKYGYYDNQRNGYFGAYKNKILRFEMDIYEGKLGGNIIKYDENGNIQNFDYVLD